MNHNIKLNIDSVINKNLLNENHLNLSKIITNPIFSIDLEKLYKEYFNADFNEFNILKLEKMFNDFKILLILIESFKQKHNNNNNCQNEQNKSKNSIFGLGKKYLIFIFDFLADNLRKFSNKLDNGG